MKAQPKGLAVSRQIILVSFKAQVPFQVSMLVLSLSLSPFPFPSLEIRNKLITPPQKKNWSKK